MTKKLNRKELKKEILNIVSKVEKLGRKNSKKIEKYEEKIGELEDEFYNERKLADKKLQSLLKLSEKEYGYNFLTEYGIDNYSTGMENKNYNFDKVSKDVLKHLFSVEPEMLEKILNEKFCYYCNKPDNNKNIEYSNKNFCSKTCLTNYKKNNNDNG